MDEEPQRRIEDLAIYIRFMEYLLSYDREKHLKFEKIKRWILEKKRYPSDVVKDIERFIFIQFKNQVLEDVNIPKKFLRLFSRNSVVKYSIVNLCSDDDDNDGDDDDDDDEDEDVSYTDPQSNKSEKSVYKKEEPYTSSSITRANKVSENLPYISKEEESCSSSLNVRDNEIKEKPYFAQSPQNDKDEVHNISSYMADVDSGDENVIENPMSQIIISDEDEGAVNNIVEKAQIEKPSYPKMNSFPKTAEITPKLLKKRREKPGVHKTFNRNTAEPIAAASSDKGKQGTSASSKLPKKRGRKPSTCKTSRVLKTLECTVAVFNETKDSIPRSANGKHLSKDSTDNSTDDDFNEKRNNELPKAAVTPVSDINTFTTSSSDTDIFDLTKFNREKQRRDEEKRKLEDQKKLITENKPVVRLLRFSPEKMVKLSNHAKSEVKTVQLVQTPDEETMQPECSSKKSTKLVKNILPGMTERNTSCCVLCKSKPSALVNHYVRSHKSEPYVARLSEDELKDLQINWPSAIPCASNAENPRILKYKVKCPFCEDEIIDSFNNFYHHFSTHTGEYGFQCEKCKLQKPFLADIQSHKHHSKSCRNTRIQTMYVYPPNLMAIYLYCCTICNFLQLNEANVHKHLRDHHDQSTSNTSTFVQKYIAAAINDAEIVNEASQESELFEDERMEEMPLQMQSTQMCKQELVLEEEAVLNASKEDLLSNLFLCDVEKDILPANIRRTAVLAHEILTTPNVTVSDQYTATNYNFLSDNSDEEVPEESQDLKPILEQIAVVSLGSLLNKLTFKTGLPPDILYQCAEATCGFFSNHELWSRHMILRHNCFLASCPHCPDKKKFTVSEFSEHFKAHCRHLYVCFNCVMTFVNKEAVVGHFQLAHNTDNVTETRFETIKFNIRYSYHILINAELHPERLEFLEALRAIIIKRLDQLATEEKSKLLNKWIVPLTADWLDNFPIYTHTRHKRCLGKSCTYKTTCENKFALHLRYKHPSMRFECSKCTFYINKCNNLDQILDHFSMHKSNIYACCVCGFYHFKRENLIAHIKNEHNSRDAPFITLHRSVEGTHVSIGVAFKPGMKILSTTRTCFFCSTTDNMSETYIKHLKKNHNVYLKYHCEFCSTHCKFCSTPFHRLMDVDEHFKSEHIGTQITISCEFISYSHIEVCNILPLQLKVVNSSALSAAKRDFDSDDSNLYPDNKRLKISCPKISHFKKELLDGDGNNSDSSVEILAEFDIICDAENKRLKLICPKIIKQRE